MESGRFRGAEHKTALPCSILWVGSGRRLSVRCGDFTFMARRNPLLSQHTFDATHLSCFGATCLTESPARPALSPELGRTAQDRPLWLCALRDLSGEKSGIIKKSPSIDGAGGGKGVLHSVGHGFAPGLTLVGGAAGVLYCVPGRRARRR